MQAERTIEPGVLFHADLKHPDQVNPDRLHIVQTWNRNPDDPKSMVVQVSIVPPPGTSPTDPIHRRWNYVISIDPPSSLPWDDEGRQRVRESVTHCLEQLQQERRRRRVLDDASSG
jgi:hypothetical protein